jgi:hypothetical protein
MIRYEPYQRNRDDVTKKWAEGMPQCRYPNQFHRINGNLCMYVSKDIYMYVYIYVYTYIYIYINIYTYIPQEIKPWYYVTYNLESFRVVRLHRISLNPPGDMSTYKKGGELRW